MTQPPSLFGPSKRTWYLTFDLCYYQRPRCLLVFKERAREEELSQVSMHAIMVDFYSQIAANISDNSFDDDEEEEVMIIAVYSSL